MKPSKPYTRKEIYLDRATGGEGAIPEPITNREHYYAKIAGASVSLPTPVIIYDKFLAKIAGMNVEVPTYNACMPHIYLFLAKAAGQDVEIPVPITREEMYWYDYINAAPQPTEKEYTGAVPVTITADGTPLIDYLISGNTVQSGTPTPENPIMPQGTGDLETVGAKAGQYKIPISSVSTATPIYLGEVQTTRKIRKFVLTGEESNWQFYQQSSPYWQYELYQFWLDNIIDSIAYSSLYSTIAPFGVAAQSRQNYEYGCYAVSSGKGIAFQMAGAKDTFVNLTAWKTYLQQQYAAGTPVTVWYVLATEETAVVNEPLMKIGDYADSISMEQTGVEIPTNNGSTTVDVDTTVKPSEVYIKYMGV